MIRSGAAGPRLPDFIVVGPPRTATTWLDKALRGRVGLPAGVKETHFFARNHARGLGWYAAHFRDCDPDLPIGEICASYFENAEAAERLHQLLPRCRIICTLRDPVERLHSYYKLMRQGGKTVLGFDEAVRTHGAMLRFSRYATQLQAWRQWFGAENVLVALNEDLVADPQAYIDRIAAFIGAAPIRLNDEVIARNRVNTVERAPRYAWLARSARAARNWLGANRLYRVRKRLGSMGVWRFCSGGGEPFGPIDPATRSWLIEQLRPDIEQLETMLSRDLTGWLGDVRQTPVPPVAAEPAPPCRQPAGATFA